MLVVDIPFLSYQASEESAIVNCGRVLQKTEADAVKVEGGAEDGEDRGSPDENWYSDCRISASRPSRFVPLGMRVQGRDEADASRMVDQAKALEDAGAFSLVLELIPTDLAQRISESISIPTLESVRDPIAMGKVLVLPDLLGLNDDFEPKFLKKYVTLPEPCARLSSGTATR